MICLTGAWEGREGEKKTRRDMNNGSRLNGERKSKALTRQIPATHMLHVAKLVSGGKDSSWPRHRHGGDGRDQPRAV